MSRPALLAGLVAVILAVSGCAGELHRASGPLDVGDGGAEVCIPITTDRDLTWGYDVLSNSSPVTVTIDEVELSHPRGLRLVETDVAPIVNQSIIGASSQWPPRHPQAVAVWERRTPAAGAELSKSQGDLNLVLHLVATSSDAGFEGIHVRYHLGNRTFVATTSIRLRARQSCSDPTTE